MGLNMKCVRYIATTNLLETYDEKAPTVADLMAWLATLPPDWEVGAEFRGTGSRSPANFNLDIDVDVDGKFIVI